MVKTLAAAALAIAAAITPASADTDFFRLDPMDRGMIMHMIASEECDAKVANAVDLESIVHMYANAYQISALDAARELGRRASEYATELQGIRDAIPMVCSIVEGSLP